MDVWQLVNLHNFGELVSPPSNPSTDQETQRDDESYFTFLVSTSQMALVDVISCLLGLELIHNILRNLSLVFYSSAYFFITEIRCLFTPRSDFVGIFPLNIFRQADQKTALLTICLRETPCAKDLV